LEAVEQAITDIDQVLGGKFPAIMGQTTIKRPKTAITGSRAYHNEQNIVLPDGVFYFGEGVPNESWAKYTIAHEYAHRWDQQQGYNISTKLGSLVKDERRIGTRNGGSITIYRYIEEPLTDYGRTSNREDWAETFAARVYSNFVRRLDEGRAGYLYGGDYPIRLNFVNEMIAGGGY
jgi:hypothetical protein